MIDKSVEERKRVLQLQRLMLNMRLKNVIILILIVQVISLY